MLPEGMPAPKLKEVARDNTRIVHRTLFMPNLLYIGVYHRIALAAAKIEAEGQPKAVRNSPGPDCIHSHPPVCYPALNKGRWAGPRRGDRCSGGRWGPRKLR